MLKCPSCSGEIQSDFGLIQCGHCGQLLLINFDGSVEISGSSPPEVQESEPVASGSFHTNLHDKQQPVENSGFAANEAPQADALEPGGNEDFQDNAWSVPVAEGFQSSAPQPPARTSTPEESLQEIRDFGNSPQLTSESSLSSYFLLIRGLDSADVKQSVREVLTEPRLMLDVPALFKAVKNGELRLSGISSVKAFFIVSALRGLPVEVDWKQNEQV